MSHYDVDMVYDWINENHASLATKLENEPGIPDEMKQVGHPFVLTFAACEWIRWELTRQYCDASFVKNAAFCVGQWGLFEDPVAKAVEYANEWWDTGTIQDKSGDRLALRINLKHLGTKEQVIEYLAQNPKMRATVQSLAQELKEREVVL